MKDIILLKCRIMRTGGNMMPLAMAGNGEKVTIKRVGGSDSVRQHLAELGFIVGEQVAIVNQVSGNLIIQVKDSRIALDKTMASKIFI